MPRRLLLPAAFLAALLQIGFLAWTIQGRAAILRDGAQVLLKVEPVDPRDLLRGDYVRLGYGISTLPRSLFAQGLPDTVEDGRTVYVLLAMGSDGVWTASSASLEPPAAVPPESRLIRGRVDGGFFGSGADLRVSYGIERFYLPEGEGLAIERDMRTRSFFVAVALAPDGTPQIKAFLDGETPLFSEPLY